jgi:serine/threonine-protein kinase
VSGSDFNPVAASGLNAGDLVGPYELIRLLGAGGMAEVWLARRADGAFKRDVALKLPLLTRRRSDLEQRFAHERDILASLEHPGIARFYDAGVDVEGLPYLSMEYVRGQTLTDWCDTKGLDVDARLALLLQVLDAVKYAHEKNVIHRDLKPSNILVTESGQVRLLDFGVAKLLQEDGDQTDLSRIYGRAFTPDYASPELLSGEPVDPRSDVYSLGMLLYELLTGTRPYRLNAHAHLAGLRRAVASASVPRPSAQITPEAAAARAASPQQLARSLRGDLDALVLKALAKETAERYDSVESMAQDLRRHQSGQLVKARLAPVSHRVARFLRRNRAMSWLVAMSILAVCITVMVDRMVLPRHAADSAPPVAFSPPVHSVAVLPFSNLSGDPKQDYFSDGISEELINALSHVEALQVSARTSSFSFKGRNVDMGAIGRQLNVGAILEGSIRRSGNTVRITAQLINTVSGYHMWSQNYDRNLGDILTLQTDIATAVAQEMQAKLLGDEAAKIEVGGTHDPTAYDAYLRGIQIEVTAQDLESNRLALAAFEQAIASDPNYAAAHAQRAHALRNVAHFSSDPIGVSNLYGAARQAAERAVELAPDYAEGHLVLGWQVLTHGFLDFRGADREIERALALSPGSASVLDGYAGFQGIMGHHDVALTAMRHAIKLDPQNPRYREHLLINLGWARRFKEVLVAVQDAKALHAEGYYAGIHSAISYLALGHPELASNLCESPATPLDEADRHFCLALAYHAQGKLSQAKRELAALKTLDGELGAANYAAIYAQWAEPAAALQWLAAAERQRNAGLVSLNVDWMFDPIRNHPQFQALVQRLGFPP